jgi:hypothetical protein
MVRGDDESGGHAVGTQACSSDIHEGLFQSPLSTHHFIENFIADLEMTELVQVLRKRNRRRDQADLEMYVNIVETTIEIFVRHHTSKLSNIIFKKYMHTC